LHEKKEEQYLLDKMIRAYPFLYDENNFWKEMKENINQKNLKILELACGCGLFINDFNERFDVKEIYITDISKVSLDYVKKNHKRTDSIIKIMDFNEENWEFPRNHFDIIFIGLTFRNAYKTFSFLKNISKHLNENGRLIIFEYIKQSFEDFSKQWFNYTNIAVPKIGHFDFVTKPFGSFCKYSDKDLEYILNMAKFEITYKKNLDSVLKTTLIFAKKLNDRINKNSE